MQEIDSDVFTVLIVADLGASHRCPHGLVTVSERRSIKFSAALNRVGSQAVSMIGTISPVSTIILAMIILGEPFTAADATGTALVTAGIALFTYHDARRSLA